MSNLIRFDWAIKRLLRNKADYCIVEGLLTVIMGRQIRISTLLESEGNKEYESDKFNRVDILAEDESGELMLFEIQNNRELDYFHRMIYGTSKAMTEYIKEGDSYRNIKKIYSINIVYFSLGQGDDYAYHGTTQFVSMHDSSDILKLSAAQRKAFGCEYPSGIFPEYYLFRVDKFDELAKTPLDEWISFLKTGEIPATATAPGLQEAREKLRVDNLNAEEKADYKRMLENLRYQKSVLETSREEGLSEGRAEGRAEGEIKGREEERQKAYNEKLDSARALKSLGTLTVSQIAMALGLSEDEVNNL